MANIFRKKHDISNGEWRWKLQRVPTRFHNFVNFGLHMPKKRSSLYPSSVNARYDYGASSIANVNETVEITGIC